MKKRIITMSCLGFFAGVLIGNGIALLLSGEAAVPVSSVLVERTGSTAAAMLVQSLLSGLFGAVCMGGTALYEIEKWPLAAASAVHYLMIAVLYIPVAFLLGWVTNAAELLIVEAFMTAGYILIWLIMYLRYKSQVRELNELLKKKHRK